METFGQVLAEFLDEYFHGWRTYDLAALEGIGSKVTLRRWVNMATQPRPRTFKQLLMLVADYDQGYARRLERSFQAWQASPALQDHALYLGRAADQQAVAALLGLHGQSRSSRVVVIRGWPGIGKTRLLKALTTQRDVRAAFSDGVIWLDLQHASPQQDIFDITVRALALDQTQFDWHELRNHLHDSHCLFVVDGFVNADQIIPLKEVMGPRCALIATTWSHAEAVRLVGSHRRDAIYRLRGLEPVMAMKLFEMVAPQTARCHSEAIPPLLTYLDHSPLAIRVVAREFEDELMMGFAEHIAMQLQAPQHLLKSIATSVAPTDRYDFVLRATPTVATIMAKPSTDIPKAAQQFLVELSQQDKIQYFEDLLTAGDALQFSVEQATAYTRLLVRCGAIEPVEDEGQHAYELHRPLAMGQWRPTNAPE